MLAVINEELPELLPFINSCCFKHSFLQFGHCTLLSDEGPQQGSTRCSSVWPSWHSSNVSSLGATYGTWSMERWDMTSTHHWLTFSSWCLKAGSWVSSSMSTCCGSSWTSHQTSNASSQHQPYCWMHQLEVNRASIVTLDNARRLSNRVSQLHASDAFFVKGWHAGLLYLCLACRRCCSRRPRWLVIDRRYVFRQQFVHFSRQIRAMRLTASCWYSETAVAEYEILSGTGTTQPNMLDSFFEHCLVNTFQRRCANSEQ